MSATCRATAGVLAAWVLAAAAHASEPRVVVGPGPALALEVVGPAGPSETFAVGPVLPTALRETALEETVRVADWPVAPGERRTVELTRHDVYAPDARIVAVGAGGETEVPRSRLIFFWGTAVGDPSRRVLLSLDPETGTLGGLGVTPDGVFEVRAAVRRGEYRIASSSEAQLAAAGRDAATDGFTCGGSPSHPDDVATSAAVPAGATTSTLSSLHTATVAVDTDNELLSLKFADSTAGATSYLASLVAGMNVIYERDLFVRLLQGHTILRLSSAADPWTQPGCPAWPTNCQSGKATFEQLTELSDYWAANYAAVPRALAMMVSGKQSSNNSFAGTAWINGLCSGSRGYSYSQVFKFAGGTAANDVHLVAHELGHNFGSRHTHCYPTATTPIDSCYSAESGCYSGPTSCPVPFTITPINGGPVVNVKGTVMSYCHMLSGCSVSPVFHPQTVDVIGPIVDAKVGACVFPAAGATSPTLSTVVPSSGSSTGGTTITLTGTGFQSGATVTFLDGSRAVAAASVTFVSSTTLTAVTPAHAVGHTDVVVGNPTKRTATKSGGFGFTLGTRPQPVWHPFFAVDPLETPYVGDFNGDGKTDIITFTRQNPPPSATCTSRSRTGRSSWTGTATGQLGQVARLVRDHHRRAGGDRRLRRRRQGRHRDLAGNDDTAGVRGAIARDGHGARSRSGSNSIGFDPTDVLQSGRRERRRQRPDPASRGSRARSTWRSRTGRSSDPRAVARLLRGVDLRAAAGGGRQRRRPGGHRDLRHGLADGVRGRVRGAVGRDAVRGPERAAELVDEVARLVRDPPGRAGPRRGPRRRRAGRLLHLPAPALRASATPFSRKARAWDRTCCGGRRSPPVRATSRTWATPTATARPTSSSSPRARGRCTSRSLPELLLRDVVARGVCFGGVGEEGLDIGATSGEDGGGQELAAGSEAVALGLGDLLDDAVGTRRRSWRRVRNSTQTHAPQASILFDKSHVLRHFGEALDRVRKSAYARLSGRDRRFIKGHKYTSLSSRQNLTLEGRRSLNLLLWLRSGASIPPTCSRSPSANSGTTATRGEPSASSRAGASRSSRSVKPYEKLAETIERRWDGSAAYCAVENKVALGFVEGLNNKVRVIQRRAYGLRDEEYLRLKILT